MIIAKLVEWLAERTGRLVKKLLIVANVPSDDTRVLADATISGSWHNDIKGSGALYLLSQ